MAGIARYGAPASRRRTRTQRVRAVVRILAAVLAVLLVAPIASAAASKPSQPLLLKAKWRRLVFCSGEPSGRVAATDRYVAFSDWHAPTGNGLSTPGPLLLIDEQTGRRKQLSGPDCARPFEPMFGGPWLLVVCPGTPLVPATYPYQLYNLTNGSGLRSRSAAVPGLAAVHGGRRAGCGRALLGPDGDRRGDHGAPGPTTTSRTSPPGRVRQA